jgi:pyruvate kinase
MESRPKIIVTLGPATNTEEALRKIKDKNVDFVRINMSHSSVEDLKYFVDLANKVGVPFMVDTEGSQIRTGDLDQNKIEFQEGDTVKVTNPGIVGNRERICLKPHGMISQLEEGDLLFVDFDTLVFRISDTSTLSEGHVMASVISQGALGSNKSVVVSSATGKSYSLPVLTDKDKESINIGLKEGVGHILVSFVRKGEDVDEARAATNNAMHVISKVESKESIMHLDEIIEKSDAILLDRGDLSKEIPIEKIPLVQKIVLRKAKALNTPVFIATNLLESMVENRKPTRAEVHDVEQTILDGASGLILSAETAIGKHPFACINMLNKLIDHARLAKDMDQVSYLSYVGSSGLIEPHGGKLVQRFASPESFDLGSMKRISMTREQQMDVEQIAVGTYSPIEGYMGREDLVSVLDSMRLANGLAWTLPIVFDVSEEEAYEVNAGDDIALTDDEDDVMAVLHVDEKYTFDKEEMSRKIYLTTSEDHPGVRFVKNMKPVFLGGKIDLIKRRKAENKAYELTPSQSRKLFEDRGWVKVVGFHTRNVIHRGHEFIQMEAMARTNSDGLFVHPVVGRKKAGDFSESFIIRAYEEMMRCVYPKQKVVFGTFATYSRYAGPREAIFTALCRKNFGCSHFIVGRDHTGVGSYYHPNASHQIFDKFPDLGIVPVRFDKVFYSNKLQQHVHEKDVDMNEDLEGVHISGTEARKLFEALDVPPIWFMRPEISSIISEAMKNNEDVFVKQD